MAVKEILKHADGTAVTPQEAYNAFMNTRVLIVKNGVINEATAMRWYDNNSAQTDPTNVGIVQLVYVGENPSGVVTRKFVSIGDLSLLPA